MVSFPSPQTQHLFAIKGKYPMTLAILRDQTGEALTVDEHTALSAGQLSRPARKQLVRQDHGTPVAVCVHSSQYPRYCALADSPGLAPELTDEICSSPREEEIGPCIRRSTNWVYRIPLGAQEVSRIAQEPLVSHRLHVLQNQRALATPSQRSKQSPEPGPAAHPQEDDRPIAVQGYGGEDQ